MAEKKKMVDAGSSLPSGTGYWVLDANGNPNIWVMTGSSIIPTYIYVGSNPKTGDTAKIEIAAAIMVLAAAALVTVMALLLAGCFGGAHREAIVLSTNEQRVAYLQELGWQVSPEPIETLDLQLPEELTPQWDEYLKLQEQQGLPFADCAGQAVRRFTYTVANYPGFPDGVQVNLFLCGDRLVGGDIIATGENGFQTVLAFPKK